jgi:hypothetical protein
MKLKSLANYFLVGAFSLSVLACKDKKIINCDEKDHLIEQYVSGKVYSKSGLTETHDGGLFSIKFIGDDSIDYNCDVIISRFCSEHPNAISYDVHKYYSLFQKNTKNSSIKIYCI